MLCIAVILRDTLSSLRFTLRSKVIRRDLRRLFGCDVRRSCPIIVPLVTVFRTTLHNSLPLPPIHTQSIDSKKIYSIGGEYVEQFFELYKAVLST